MAGVIRKVIVIEDQTILLDLICKYLESIPTFEIVGRTGDGREGYELCLKHRPDFLILDIMLPNLNGMEILDRLKNKSPRTRILVFSATTRHRNCLHPRRRQIKTISRVAPSFPVS